MYEYLFLLIKHVFSDHLLGFMWNTSVSDKLAVSIVRFTVSRAWCGPTRLDMKLMGFQIPGWGGEEVKHGPAET
jgi:hypothetical protein